MFGNFYSGKTVLVTGHTGFKGVWLGLWLRDLGAAVHGLALAPHVPPNLHEALAPGTFSSETIGDIGELDCVQACLAEVQCTASWYHQRHEAQLEDLHGLCLSQIETFNSDAASQKIAWAK